MTAKEGFVWFLPVYVTLKLNEKDIRENNEGCTEQELREALHEHFSLAYATISTNDNQLLPNNNTVGEWKKNYIERRGVTSISPSDYAPFVYDGIWVYVKALLKLIEAGNW